MAQRGRKPKPTAIKVLEGNPGKRSLNTAEPKPEKKAPRCPSWLEEEAKKEWKRMSKQLEQLGILTEIDMAAFAGYCQAYARWKEAEEFIAEQEEKYYVIQKSGTRVKCNYGERIHEMGRRRKLYVSKRRIAYML